MCRNLSEEVLDKERIKNSKSKKMVICLCIIVILIIIIVGIVIIIKNNEINKIINISLDKEVNEGKITYYVSSMWESNEKQIDNIKYKYYYPSENSMLMVMISFNTDTVRDNDEYFNNFFDEFVSGIECKKIISKNKKNIKGNNVGVVRFLDKNDYENVVYIILNNNESYCFGFGIQDKWNDKYIELMDNILIKSNIISETEEEKVEKIEKYLEKAKSEIESENTNVVTLKEIKSNLETYKNDIEYINLKEQGNINKKDLWNYTISQLIENINKKIQIIVPDFNTMSKIEATNWGNDNDVKVITTTEYSNKISNGKFIRQSINSGSVIEKGKDTIEIVYSLGKQPTLGEKNALSRAKEYIDVMSFSYKGLIKQLEFEGFTNTEARYGADNCGADWNQQAAKKAKEYLSNMSFSKNGLIEQLVFEGFTSEQAQYGVSSVGY